LARDCARDAVVRKFVEPALELIMLEKALRGKFSREEARLLFGEMYATALAGDGYVGPGAIMLAVGGELGGGAEFGKGKGGKKLLRIKITAEVDGVRGEYTITFGRYGRNAALGFAVARADVPGGREADAERFAAVIEALTDVKPRIRRRSDGILELVCGREHLDGFARFAELAGAIKRWLEETRR
jgi:hypothetical protein